MKDLLFRQSNYAAAASKLQVSSPFKPFALHNAASVSGVSASTSASTESSSVEVNVAKGAAQKEGNSLENLSEVSSAAKPAVQNPLFAFSPSSGVSQPSPLAAKAQPLSSGSDFATGIQEIVSKIPAALRGSNLDGKGSFSMDMTLDGVGQLKLSIERSGDRITVSLQSDSESTKDQLNGQRQDLEREMRNLGYNDVSVDVGSSSTGGDFSNEDWRRRGSGSSNADSEDNVKLSGNAKADLSEILAMN